MNLKFPSSQIFKLLTKDYERIDKTSMTLKKNGIQNERLRGKTIFPNATRINNFIVKKLAEAEKLILDLEEKNLMLSAQRIRKEIFGTPSGSLY